MVYVGLYALIYLHTILGEGIVSGILKMEKYCPGHKVRSPRSISECIWFWSILKVHELKACKINNWIHFSQKFDIKITWVFWLFQLLIFSFIFVGYWTRIVEIISNKWFYYRNRKQEPTTLINRFHGRLKWFAITDGPSAQNKINWPWPLFL